MKSAAPSEAVGSLSGSFEPYSQLIRALLPRASTIALFDGAGELEWSTDGAVGDELLNIVDDALLAARADQANPGQLRRLPGDGPVYLFNIRDDGGALRAVLALVCRASGSGASAATELHTFGFVHSLLKPALECLRRDLMARESIASLAQRVSTLDRDLEMVLADTDRADADTVGPDELKNVLQKTVEHLKCDMAALIVPDKGLVLMCSGPGATVDGALVARIHRQLVSMAQMRREPVVINRLAPNPALGAVPFRILSCPVRNAAGRTSGVLALFRHIDGPELGPRDARMGDLVARKAASLIEASYDAMTGLLTRHAFEQRVRAAVAGGTSWTALYIDSDQLHVINDNHGMHVGDRVIAQLGELIRKRLPPNAFAARISGDRFAAVLPGSLEDAARFAESLREGALAVGATNGEAHVHVSVSIGVATLERESRELTHCLAAAETACKAAKDRGRNRVECYAADDPSIVRRFTDINIAARLRAALAEDRLRLDAQLILPFGTTLADARPHFELLLRMIDEDGSTVGPDRFLSAANRYQLMPAIDRWVIEKAIALLVPHAEMLATRPAVFAINFSGQSLSDESFGDFLLERIGKSGLDPALFCFELTETATVANVSRAETVMRQLRQLGCGVALDDFGTGLSSLSYLRQLPVTMLKIDGSFVRDILTDPRAESMVNAIAQLARSMSIATVAEYVETDEIRSRVAALGVDYGQGFAIGRPALIDAVLAEIPVLASAMPVRIPPSNDVLELEPGSARMVVAH